MTSSEFWKHLRHRIWSEAPILLLVRPAGKPLNEELYRRLTERGGEIYSVTEKQLGDYAPFGNANVHMPVFQKILQKGGIVHLGYLNGKCVYRHAAQCSGDIEYEGCLVRHLGLNEMMTGLSFCAPEARGHGWQTRSLYKMFQEKPEYTAYTLVREKNPASLVACLHAGYEIRDLLTVKNRIFHRSLTQRPLSKEEIQGIIAQLHNNTP